MAGITRVDDGYLRDLFSQNLRQILSDKKITQRAFGEMMGVSEQYVSRWISGAQSPNWKTFADICSKLGVKPRYFMSDPEDNSVHMFHHQIEEAQRILRSIEKKVSGI